MQTNLFCMIWLHLKNKVVYEMEDWTGQEDAFTSFII